MVFFRHLAILLAGVVVAAGQVAPSAQSGTTADGFVYATASGVVTITGYTGSDVVITIPSTIGGIPVTNISDNAFQNRITISSLTIPSSVIGIGRAAFAGCTSLTSLSFASPSSLTSIGTSAFANCTGLTGSLTIPNGVTSIGPAAFAGCTGLTGNLTLPNSLTTIGGYAFWNCTGLTGRLTIPSSVISIGVYAFEFCRKLTGLVFASPSSLTSIGTSAFANCTGLTGSLTIPSSVTIINGLAFLSCSGLTSLNFASPSKLGMIGNSAFEACTGLTGRLTIPSSVTDISWAAFRGCTSLTSLSFAVPSKLDAISDNAFSNCTGLTGSLTFPRSLRIIGSTAFERCHGITSVLFLGKGPPEIRYQAFLRTDNLQKVYYLSSATDFPRAVEGKPAEVLADPIITAQPASRTVNTGTSVTFAVNDSGFELTYQWQRNGTPIPNATKTNYTIDATTPVDAGSYAVVITNAYGLVTSNTAILIVTSAPPTVTVQPGASNAVLGQSASFSVVVSGTPPFTYQWRKNGIEITGATSSTYSIGSTSASDSGSYTVVVTNSVGSATSSTAALTVTAAATAPRLFNLSVRAALDANQIAIVGFTMSGGAKNVLLRAAGPTLSAFEVPGVMADPKLDLYRESTKVSTNDNWGGQTTLSTAFASVGAFPYSSTTSLDAALVSSIDGGQTVHVYGPTAGTVLIEAYDAGTGDSQRFTNLSARNKVGVGANILIAGFTLEGSGTRNLLIRAVGPKLTDFNVSGVLADPKLEIYSGTTKLYENDNWPSSLSTTFASVGAFALNTGSKDAAITVALPAGGYTVHVSGADGGIGEAIVEIYELP